MEERICSRWARVGRVIVSWKVTVGGEFEIVAVNVPSSI